MKISANGIQINFELSGRNDAPVVVLSHSLAANMGMWDPQMSVLTARYQVLRYDMRGHGASEAPPGPYSFDMLAADVVALLDTLKISRCLFVGLSIGGMIGQALALKKTPHIATLTLCATSSRMPPEMHATWDARIGQVQSQGMNSIASATLERWFTPTFRTNHPGAVAKVGEMISSTPVNGFAGCASAIKTLDFTARLHEIKLPTHLIVGREDPGTPVAASETIQREIAGSSLVVLENAMHICNIEQPETFNRALLDFLDRQT